MKTFKKGFTLIELLIVIVIIGILAVGFAPTLLNGPKKARDAVRKGNLANIQKAIEAYALEKGSYVGSNRCLNFMFDGALLTYFQGGILPTDPSGPSYDLGDTGVGGKHCTGVGNYFYTIAHAMQIKDCYILGTKVEDTSSGNSDVTIDKIHCDHQPAVAAAKTGNFYYKIVAY